MVLSQSVRRMASLGPVHVLDGGMGHLLRRKGVEIKGEIGSTERFLGVALANLQQPQLVQDAHEDFLRAGANIVTTNNYACVPRVVGNDERLVQAIEAAGTLARAAADKYQGFVAGSLPPLGASYRPDLVGDQIELERDYALIAKIVAPFSDVLLCETMSSVREAKAAVRAAANFGKPVWVAWTLAEDTSGNLLSGESLEEAVDALDLGNCKAVEACLFNCSQPESINAALPRLRSKLPPSIRIGAYGNGFQTVHAKGSGSSEYRQDLTPTAYAGYCKQWVSAGASIVGGCCGIFPEHIVEVAKAQRRAAL